MGKVKEYPETHQTGYISFENIATITNESGNIFSSMKGDLGIQIAADGRVWICIDGIAFLRFRPITLIKK